MYGNGIEPISTCRVFHALFARNQVFLPESFALFEAIVDLGTIISFWQWLVILRFVTLGEVQACGLHRPGWALVLAIALVEVRGSLGSFTTCGDLFTAEYFTVVASVGGSLSNYTSTGLPMSGNAG